jgi:putative toxin-antitoxin system antitoxin component (TIGR02293 family)
MMIVMAEERSTKGQRLERLQLFEEERLLAAALLKKIKSREQLEDEQFQRSLTEELIHELSAPLGVIDSLAYYLELIGNDENTITQLEHIRAMVSQANRILERSSAVAPTSPMSNTLSSGELNDKTLGPIIERVTEVIGDQQEAMRWLGTPLRGLGFATPISLLGTEEGSLRVADILGQMEHGIW